MRIVPVVGCLIFYLLLRAISRMIARPVFGRPIMPNSSAGAAFEPTGGIFLGAMMMRVVFYRFIKLKHCVTLSIKIILSGVRDFQLNLA